MENIKNFDEEIYNDKVDAFIDEVGIFEDGKASKRVVELVKENRHNI